MKVRIKELVKGHSIYHDKFGCLQFIGLARINPYSNTIARPYRYEFSTDIDLFGSSCIITLVDGCELVELVQSIEA